jgi:hypothetical protein
MRTTVRVLRSEPDEQISPQLAAAVADLFRGWARER